MRLLLECHFAKTIHKWDGWSLIRLRWGWEPSIWYLTIIALKICLEILKNKIYPPKDFECYDIIDWPMIFYFPGTKWRQFLYKEWMYRKAQVMLLLEYSIVMQHDLIQVYNLMRNEVKWKPRQTRCFQERTYPFHIRYDTKYSEEQHNQDGCPDLTLGCGAAAACRC